MPYIIALKYVWVWVFFLTIVLLQVGKCFLFVCRGAIL